jgi:hypothetical protein
MMEGNAFRGPGYDLFTPRPLTFDMSELALPNLLLSSSAVTRRSVGQGRATCYIRLNQN